jgi:hypothetical protein
MSRRTDDNCYRFKGGEWVRCTHEWAFREESLWIEFSCDAQHLWTAYIVNRLSRKPNNTLKGYRSLSLARQAAFEFASTYCKK